MSWQDFLRAQGAAIDDETGVVRFDTATAAEPACALVPLLDFGLIRFAGEETVPFLHGQLSSDVKKLADTGAQYSSYSTPKGRMLASLLLLREGDDLLLMLPRALQPAIQKRLAMYVLRSKTRASDAGAERALLGLAGPKALALGAEVFGRAPEADLAGMAIDGGLLVRLPGERLLAVLEPAAAEAAWPRLVAAGAVAAGSDAWTLADIRAGIPWVVAGTQEEFVPQMANMELIGAVNFKKGCYPGQEIVARTQYLGKLKRRTYRIRSTVALQPGQPVYSPEMNGQPSGLVALAAPAGDAQWEALAVVQISSVAHGLHLEGPDGPAVEVLTLPYPVHE